MSQVLDLIAGFETKCLADYLKNCTTKLDDITIISFQQKWNDTIGVVTVLANKANMYDIYFNGEYQYLIQHPNLLFHADMTNQCLVSYPKNRKYQSNIIIAGKSCSGKDTLQAVFTNNWNYKKLINYTTRPPRPFETDGVDYHFVNDTTFDKLIEDDFFIEHREYTMKNHGKVRYGSAKAPYLSNESLITISTPEGIRTIKKHLSKEACENLVIVYLDAPRNIRKRRALSRIDDVDIKSHTIEVIRRLDADDIDFKDFENEADIVIKITDDMTADMLAKSILNTIGRLVH